TPLPTTGPWPRGCAPDRPRSTAAEVAGSGHADGWSCWPSPAKLNLFLHIPRRRADGYHELQTVFRLLDWGGTWRSRVRADPGFRPIVPSVDGVRESGVLLVRAARLLHLGVHVGIGADISVEMRIPAGAGFGGGSSNAATV